MTFKELFPLQVVINLDSRPDRLKVCMEEEFPKLGIIPVRKPGIVFTQAGNAFSNGSIGCLLSHYDILQAALILQTNVFIFEDDIKFINDAETFLDYSCDELQDIKWDMFYLAGNLLKPAYKVSKHLARVSWCQSTVAYGINKKFIEELLSYINLQEIKKPIDLIYAQDIIPNHNCFITYPLLGIQRDDFSNIEGKEVKYSEYLESRYWENIKDEK